MWAYTFIAAFNVCMVNLENDTKMSYILKAFEHGLFWQVSVIFSLGINLSDCERGGTREKVCGMRMDSAAERRKVSNNFLKIQHGGF